LTIAAVLDGASRKEAGKIGSMDRQTLRDWVIRFNEQGPDDLINIPPPGVPPKLDEEHKAFLTPIVEEGPVPAVHGVVRWRACCSSVNPVPSCSHGIEVGLILPNRPNSAASLRATATRARFGPRRFSTLKAPALERRRTPDLRARRIRRPLKNASHDRGHHRNHAVLSSSTLTARYQELLWNQMDTVSNPPRSFH
jgi:hypothetical protein